MAQRTTLKGHAIPADPPTAEDFSFPPDLYDIMPDPFHNLLDSVATSGSEFALYIRRYQSDTHTPYVIMSALLASFQILNYNVKSLAGGLAFVNPDEREEIGEPSALTSPPALLASSRGYPLLL